MAAEHATRRLNPRSIRDSDFERYHPVYAVWELTLACDLGCSHCGSRASPDAARPGELTTEQCLDVVAQMDEAGVREVTLIGGEAYLRNDFAVIARAITTRGIKCTMVTGARNLTQERVDAAAAAGVAAISVSLDGLQRTHDAVRGRGSFDAAIEGARRVAASTMRLNANTQLNRLSTPELPGIADLLVDLGARAWQVQLTVPMGRAADRPQLLLQPWELLELFPLLLWVKQHKLDPAGIALGPSNNVGYFSPFETLLRWRGDEGLHWNGCVAGKWSIGIEADGKLKGCPSLPSTPYTGGNLKERRLLDIFENTDQLTHLHARTRDDLWGYCADCYYADDCLGGCTWTAHTLFGRSGNNPYCIHRAMQFEAQGLRETVRRVEQAEGAPFDHGKFELVVEPMPDLVDGESPTICGVEASRSTSATGFDEGLWAKDALKELLRRAR